MTTCPYCADPIEGTHTSCPHCGESLDGGGADEFELEDDSASPVRPAGSRRGKAKHGAVQRPGGVTFYAWANCVVGVIGLLATIGFVIGAVAMFASSDKYAGVVGIVFLIAAGISVVVGGPLLAMGLGMFRLKRWARIMTLVVSGLFAAGAALETLGLLAVAVDQLMSSRTYDLPQYIGGAFGSFLWFAFNAGQLFVLTRPDAKEAFEAA